MKRYETIQSIKHFFNQIQPVSTSNGIIRQFDVNQTQSNFY